MTEVSLREMVAAMASLGDDETFRWFQGSRVEPDGSIHPTITYRVSMGQARRELGLTTAGPQGTM